MIRSTIRVADRLAHVGAWASGVILVVTSAIIGVDVIARKMFSLTLGMSHEIGGYALAISSAWAFSFTLLKRGHIRIDALYNVLPMRIRAVLDLVALLALGAFVGAVTWYGMAVLQTSILLGARANTPLGTPMWIPQSLWFAGLCVFMLTVVVLALAALRSILAGDPLAAQRVIGIHGAEEEVEEEMREATKAMKALEQKREE